MRYAYPVVLMPDEDGRLVASFPDVPEALTDGAGSGGGAQERDDKVGNGFTLVYRKGAGTPAFR
ncbi:MAG: type II toxin-antitoxin system HicB family antitoxin [Gammaproteobacteria bacterium]